MHEYLIEFTALVTALGILITAVSSLTNGFMIRRTRQQQAEQHNENSERLQAASATLEHIAATSDTVIDVIKKNGSPKGAPE